MRARRPRCGADADRQRERDGVGRRAGAEGGGGSGDGGVEVVVDMGKRDWRLGLERTGSLGVEGRNDVGRMGILEG